ncbi:MAG: type III pantothenate kinase [Ferruginibacter sp.]
MTTLCLDFGNTRLKAGLFIDDVFTKEILLPEDGLNGLREIINEYHPQKSILSSVINHNDAIEKLLADKTQFHKLSVHTKINFTTPVGKPETIGADRLALVAAAIHFFPGKNNLIISLGSCITYNFINQYSQFLGGSISPGMEMRYKSMHDFTAKLPWITAVPETIGINYPLVGYDTNTNLLSGVLKGILYELDGFIDAYSNKYGNFNVLLTGGNSAYFAGQLKNKIFADSNFLYKGLYALSELNNCTT